MNGAILVVEDVPLLQVLERRMLESLELQVVIIASGKESIDVALEKRFDLILMDLDLPDMGGIEVTRQLREQGCNTPVFIVTTDLSSQSQSSAGAAGVNGFLSKPISRLRLEEIVNHSLKFDAENPHPMASLAMDKEDDEHAAIDVDYALDVVGGSIEDYRELVEIFLEYSETLKQKIKANLEDGDGSSAARHLHQLKGCALQLGANRLSNEVISASAQITSALDSIDVRYIAEEIAQAIETTQRQFQSVLTELCIETSSQARNVILVIDDDPIFRKQVKLGLEKAHFQVVGLESGVHAISKIREHGVCLVILDILMEEREGIETLTELREVYPDLPVIMVSVDSLYLSFSEGLGASRTMVKPIPLQTLLSSVKQLLQEQCTAPMSAS